MHEALISVSARSLARSHLARLQSFTGPSSSTALADAEDRVRLADKSVAEAMNDMNDSFAELLWRTTRDGRGPDADAFERDAIKERLAKLESLSTNGALLPQPSQQQAPLPTPSPAIPATPASAIPAPPPPPPTSARADVSAQDVEMDGKNGEDGEVEQIEHKRRRAKDLLKDVLRRLDAMEHQRDELNIRCDDLENWIWENAENDVQAMSWDRLEAARLTLHSMPPMERSRKRRKVEEAVEVAKVDVEVQTESDPEGAPAPAVDDKPEGPGLVGSEPGPTDTMDTSTKVDATAALLAENAELKAEMEGLRTTITDLQGQFEKWRAMGEQRDRAIITACMREMTASTKGLVKTVRRKRLLVCLYRSD